MELSGRQLFFNGEVAGERGRGRSYFRLCTDTDDEIQAAVCSSVRTSVVRGMDRRGLKPELYPHINQSPSGSYLL